MVNVIKNFLQRGGKIVITEISKDYKPTKKEKAIQKKVIKNALKQKPSGHNIIQVFTENGELKKLVCNACQRSKVGHIYEEGEVKFGSNVPI